eukprot:CAMPEP_0203844774 /NCGR_PEP_ID=MMETSP0359-20131031/3410_1 /ASSEMBLY_ACC=CAM_ASM_000338 /TAXON_ID=268821 /ORGANISM="Scrippsiella Hangoei, Strain SHTV-5" /LENGTH=262 /DNA_ID=CAMNT_0050759787 /DNA_START=101 /DNA_END=886 /DNA_ORIENTATION=-
MAVDPVLPPPCFLPLRPGPGGSRPAWPLAGAVLTPPVQRRSLANGGYVPHGQPEADPEPSICLAELMADEFEYKSAMLQQEQLLQREMYLRRQDGLIFVAARQLKGQKERLRCWKEELEAQQEHRRELGGRLQEHESLLFRQADEVRQQRELVNAQRERVSLDKDRLSHVPRFAAEHARHAELRFASVAAPAMPAHRQHVSDGFRASPMQQASSVAAPSGSRTPPMPLVYSAVAPVGLAGWFQAPQAPQAHSAAAPSGLAYP